MAHLNLKVEGYKKILFLLLIFLLVSMSSYTKEPRKPGKQEKIYTIFIGTYTSGESEGIYQCSFNPNTGELSGLKVAAKKKNPSFLTISPKQKFLYCVNETMNYKGKSGGAVSAFSIDSVNNTLQFINDQSSKGGAPCHIITDKTGRFVLTANYMGGNVAVYPINSDGSIGDPASIVQHKGSGKNPDRQKAPHAHSVILDPSNKYAFVSDLGIDKIMIYRFNAKTGILTPANIPWVNLQPGAGPRHFTFHPNGEYAYVINELNSTISSFSYQSKDGVLTEIQTITTLPVNFKGNNSCADIHISPSGKYLYGSNRGHNSIVCYSIDEKTGKLKVVDFESTLGETPRNFTIDPSGTFLLVANQNTNTIVTFRIDSQTGKLNFTKNMLSVPSPVCIKFLE